MPICNLCPRNCKVNREMGERGVCQESDIIRVARASLHMWEEPPISGERGSGTVFFSGCPLRCVFCQNHNIADGTNGTAVTVDELCSIFLHLQEMGAHNINLVTATHFVPGIRRALIKAKGLGLSIPIVYNTSSYETVSTLKMLNGVVDIYLPDLKYVSSELSTRYSKAPDYFEYASAAIDEMVAQQPVIKYDDNGLLIAGVVVRHLLLPGCIDDSKQVLKYLHERYGENIFISIMSQYTPLADNLKNFPEINRKVTNEEYDELVDYAVSLGITNAFVQEGEAAEESFIPDFENWDLKKFLLM